MLFLGLPVKTVQDQPDPILCPVLQYIDTPEKVNVVLLLSVSLLLGLQVKVGDGLVGQGAGGERKPTVQ